MDPFRITRCRFSFALGLLLLAVCGDVDAGREGSPALRPDLVVVVLDAARAAHFGSYGYDRETTPRADAFAAGATRYRHVRSEASYTFLATGALFAGASPAETGLGARSGGRVPASLELLAERARASGYRTFGYSENPYVTPYFGLAQGFDRFDEAYPTEALRAGLEPAAEIDSSARLGAMLEEAIRDDTSPYFLYAHLLRPHNPYQPPTPWRGHFGATPADHGLGATGSLIELGRRGPPFDPVLLERLVMLYDENLAYGDALFGELLDRLEAAGRGDRTVVVLTADHGEGFGEEGALLHSTRLDDAMLRVPLLIRVPGVESGVAAAPIQLADLGRGLRRFLAGSDPAELTRLDALRDSDRPLVSWTNAATGWMAAWRDGHRLVLDARSGRVLRYDRPGAVGAPAGPAPALDAAGRALSRILEAKRAAWTGGGAEVGDPGPLDPLRRRQLEALGYVEP